MTPIAPTPEFLALQAALAGEYSLERELGRGGMGIVYLARDVQLDRDVAIKVLPTHLTRQAGARERFIREARTAAGLSHPHIVPIHRVGEARGFVFFVMSYVAGETLGERLRAQGPLPAADVTRIMREVAWALAYAHGRGIVHRDVKPDNILLEAGSGRALVTDFGIAHAATVDEPATDPGRIMGTAHFMSPEQAGNEAIDGRSDIYSLGVVGYLSLSGRLPFDSPNVPALLLRQATQAAPSVALAAPGLPSSLASTIDRCLDREPSRRFDDGESLAAALAARDESRPALPSTLRAWLSATNPALPAYAAWSGLFSLGSLSNLAQMIGGEQYGRLPTVLLTAAAAAAPLIPILGFHLNQARRLFRSGHTLADLRAALDVAARERDEGQAAVVDKRLTPVQRALHGGTIASACATAITVIPVTRHMFTPTSAPYFILVPAIAAVVFASASNAMDVPLMPAAVRARFRSGLRDRLWRSGAGQWLARRLGAPERSRVGAGDFRATEVALGVAAADLFAALPKAYREQLAELPETVAALEARAAEARAHLEMLGAMAAPDRDGGALLEARRTEASGRLAATVAALEGIRLDLLRLHADAGDMAPLTTLLDAARLLGDDIGRLAEAQREVMVRIPGRLLGADRVPTPV